jgi:hypothetical protein
MSPYWAIVGYNSVAQYLMRCAWFLNSINRRILGTALFLIGWLIGQKARAARLWLQANGY